MGIKLTGIGRGRAPPLFLLRLHLITPWGSSNLRSIAIVRQRGRLAARKNDTGPSRRGRRNETGGQELRRRSCKETAAIPGAATRRRSLTGKFYFLRCLSSFCLPFPAPVDWVARAGIGDSHGSPSCRLSAVFFTRYLAGAALCRHPCFHFVQSILARRDEQVTGLSGCVHTIAGCLFLPPPLTTALPPLTTANGGQRVWHTSSFPVMQFHS